MVAFLVMLSSDQLTVLTASGKKITGKYDKKACRSIR